MDQQAKFFHAAEPQQSLSDRFFYPVIGTATAVLIAGVIAVSSMGSRPVTEITPQPAAITAPKPAERSALAVTPANSVAENGVKPPAPPEQTPLQPALAPSTQTGVPPPTASTATNNDDSTITVYVTNTGSKYHCAGCQYLRQSSIPMTLADARQKYTACSVCGGVPTAVSRSVVTSAASPAPSSYNPYPGTPTGGTTATGIPTYVGPRGGVYHISKNGNRVYEKRR